MPNPMRAAAASFLFAAGLALASPTALAQHFTRLGPGVVRADADRRAYEEALPSLSFEDPAEREGGQSVRRAGRVGRVGVRPEFSRAEDGRFRVRVPVEAGTSLYGTGEVAGPLERTGRRVVLWNSDSYGYTDETPSLYQSHPWVLAVRADGSAFGVLADTTFRCEVDTGDGIAFTAEGPAFPVIVFEGQTPQEVITRLTEYVGRIDLPPLWALGYHQCRYSYYPDTRALEVAREFRARDIPCDVIWHDIHYMEDYLVFTFHPERFPDPTAHNAALHELGFKTVWMIDPGIGDREGYFVRDQLLAGDHGVRTAAGETYRGEVWPGWCVFPDFTRAETRSWWAGLYADFMAAGVDGVWNDMNEPAVFNVPSKTMPEDNVHRADAALGGEGPHAQYHNVYGMLMVRASREGIMAANPEKRPFVLSRANFMGGHRYAAMWTGDNVASWQHLEWSVPMALSMGLSGQPFAGPDIGGFIGDGDAEMYARWMGFGALLPFARGHTDVNSRDKEPWSFGPEVEEACRLAIRRRYELLPHFYTLFREASVNGLPVARPLFFDDPKDPALRTEDDAFLLGSGLMVVPQLVPDRTRVPVLPKGIWRPVALTGAGHPDLPEMYIKGGAIVPTGPIMEHTGERPLDPLTLLVSLDENGRAEGTLYEDAGEGHGHRAGDYLLTTYEARRRGDRVEVRVKRAEGDRERPERELRVRVILDGGAEVAGSGRDGVPVVVGLGGR